MSSDLQSDDPSPAADSLLEALEAQVPGAREHADATGRYASDAAAELGLDRERCEQVREAARLHEVGRLYEPGEDRYEAGYRLARGAGVPELACAWLLRVRECFDGSGAEGLSGEAIPVESRLIRAACVLHGELSAPAADEAEARGRAVERLGVEAGGALDPAVVQALLAILTRPAT